MQRAQGTRGKRPRHDLANVIAMFGSIGRKQPWMGVPQTGFQKVQRIEFARQQALDAYTRANECMDTRQRDEWLKTAALWEAICRQYEMLLKVNEAAMVGEAASLSSSSETSG